jgi:hypothetical protein
MAKMKRMYITRRGRRYLIERGADGTFGRWILLGAKKGGMSRMAGKTTKKVATKTKSSVIKSNRVEAKPANKKLAAKKPATKKSASKTMSK